MLFRALNRCFALYSLLIVYSSYFIDRCPKIYFAARETKFCKEFVDGVINQRFLNLGRILNVSSPKDYSHLRATMGSTRMARRAGIWQAASVRRGRA